MHNVLNNTNFVISEINQRQVHESQLCNIRFTLDVHFRFITNKIKIKISRVIFFFLKTVFYSHLAVFVRERNNPLGGRGETARCHFITVTALTLFLSLSLC